MSSISVKRLLILFLFFVIFIIILNYNGAPDTASLWELLRSLYTLCAQNGQNIAVFIFGAGIGVSELVARYKDAPGRALVTFPAFLYIIINALAGPLALYLIKIYGVLGSLPEETRSTTEVLLAGTGAMAFFRSAVFTVRVGNTDIGVGPAGLLQIILNTADRATDRDRAGPRARAVAEIMKRVSFEKAREVLPSVCFALMQNVSAEETKALGNLVRELQEKKEMEDGYKAYNLGLWLMNLVGQTVLQEAVDILRDGIIVPPKPIATSVETVASLKNVDFKKEGMAIIRTCLFLTGQYKAPQPIKKQYRPSGKPDPTIKHWEDRYGDIERMLAADRVLLLARLLLSEFEEKTVLMAIRSVKMDGGISQGTGATGPQSGDPGAGAFGTGVLGNGATPPGDVAASSP